MDEELKDLEDQLEKLSPTAMPDDMVARMAQAMDRWQENLPAEEKLVHFKPVEEVASPMRRFNVWASAAAVALVGAVSLLFINENEPTTLADTASDTKIVEPIQKLIPEPNIGESNSIVTASNTQFDTAVKRASDDVITYDAKGRPMRVMQVHFEDVVTVKGKDGKVYKIKQPRIEYYAVPVEIH